MLQYGVTINNVDWLHIDRCRFDMIITTSTSEHLFFKSVLGYSDTIIKQTGLARFDNLHQNSSKKG